jgi:hypothetical protein
MVLPLQAARRNGVAEMTDRPANPDDTNPTDPDDTNPTDPDDTNPTDRYEPPQPGDRVEPARAAEPAVASPPPAEPPAPPIAPSTPPPPPSQPWPPPSWRGRGHDPGRIGTIVFGAILLVIGLWFFADQTLGLEMPRLRWSQLWPILLVGLGAWIAIGSMRRR